MLRVLGMMPTAQLLGVLEAAVRHVVAARTHLLFRQKRIVIETVVRQFESTYPSSCAYHVPLRHCMKVMRWDQFFMVLEVRSLPVLLLNDALDSV